jgi:hypothetical protein
MFAMDFSHNSEAERQSVAVRDSLLCSGYEGIIVARIMFALNRMYAAEVTEVTGAPLPFQAAVVGVKDIHQ